MDIFHNPGFATPLGCCILGFVIAYTVVYFVQMHEYRQWLRQARQYLENDRLIHSAISITKALKPYLREDADEKEVFTFIKEELMCIHKFGETTIDQYKPDWGPS
jgi:hypothetical protein